MNLKGLQVVLVLIFASCSTEPSTQNETAKPFDIQDPAQPISGDVSGIKEGYNGFLHHREEALANHRQSPMASGSNFFHVDGKQYSILEANLDLDLQKGYVGYYLPEETNKDKEVHLFEPLTHEESGYYKIDDIYVFAQNSPSGETRIMYYLPPGEPYDSWLNDFSRELYETRPKALSFDYLTATMSEDIVSDRTEGGFLEIIQDNIEAQSPVYPDRESCPKSYVTLPGNSSKSCASLKFYLTRLH